MNITEPKIPSDDKLAKQEYVHLYKKSARESQSEGHKHIIRLIFIWFCSLSVIAIFITRVIYLIYPNSWLTEEHITKLDEFLIHGSIGAIMVSILKPIWAGKE